MTPCKDYFFVLDRVKPITEGVIESWLVGKFRDIIDGKVRQHRFVCKSNIINHVRFTLKGMIYWKILYIPLPLLPPFQYISCLLE